MLCSAADCAPVFGDEQCKCEFIVAYFVLLYKIFDLHHFLGSFPLFRNAPMESSTQNQKDV